MKRRWKILTAILLSAAMTATSLSPGFASEAVPDGEAGLASEETVITETEEQQDESSQGFDDQSGEQTPESSNETTITGSGEQDDENTEADQPEDAEDQDGADEMDEASDNDAPAADDASGEDDNDTVSDSQITVVVDDDVERTITEHQFIHAYDGKEYNPGKYSITTGQKVRRKPEKTAPVIYTGPATFTLDPVTTVSQGYTLYIYPEDATQDYSETIKVSVTPRPVTYRSKTYTKQMDGKPLSQNLAEPDDLPKCVRGTMVGEQKFKFNFDPNAKQIEVGSSKNKFTVSNSATADVNNYDVSYEYGNLIVTASRNTVNGLPTPTKAKAVVQNNGSIKISWKGVKSYKDTGKKGGKTRYKVYKYKEDDTWIDLKPGEAITKCSLIDANPSEGERFIYKIIPMGYDSSGVNGEAEQPAYVRATPKILSVSPYEGIDYARVTFMGLGTDLDKYTLEHWNAKAKGVKDQIPVDKYNSDQETYNSKKRGISVNSYLDKGGDSVTISGNNKATFNFRVMAEETTVYDYGSPVTVQSSAWSKIAKLKMISMAPLLKGKRESNTSFKLKWNKIAKATGYLIEYSKDKNFKASETWSVYVSKKEKQSNYNEREYTVKDVGTGIPYYCKVTAYNKKNGDGSAYGIALGTSNTIVQYGRQKAVKKLEAEYNEDGDYRSDAKLTWEDDEDGVKGYYVQKWSYEYNPSTKEYDKQTKYEVLNPYNSTSSTPKKKYTIGTGNKVVNGELVKYRVQSVKYLGGKLGEYGDGYVFGESSEYYYMNPTETQFKKKKYTVAKDSELDMSKALKFKPAKKPKKADGLTQSEFKEIFCFNDEMKYVLQSDELTNSKIKEYVTVTVADGKLKGVKKYTKSAIELKAYSPNDPDNVYATTQINVGDASDGEGGGSGGGGSSGTTVCIDPGHGGDDAGAEKNGIKEKEMNLKIAKKVGDELKSLGLKVVYTRDEDKEVSLTKRTDIAKDKGCALFVSIHCNSSDDSSANGTEVYYSVESKYAKKGLAEKISEAVSSKLGTKNIGAKTRKGSDGDYYSVIRTSAQKGIPGLIVEHAFISNSSDASKLQDSDKLDAMAKAEAKAIYNSLK